MEPNEKYDWVIPIEMLDQTEKIDKLQARLEAAETVCDIVGSYDIAFTDVIEALDNWRKVKGGG